MTWLLWLGFVLLVLLLVAIDLGVLHRRAEVMTATSALRWTGVWVALSLVFNAVVYVLYDQQVLGLGQELDGEQAATLYFTAYLLEKSLSLDNIFVISLVFAGFQVPAKLQHRVLFWGILGALVLRGGMILGGLTLLNQLSWTSYAFGALLLYTSYKMLTEDDDEEGVDLEKNWWVRQARRIFPLTDGFRGERYFVREGGKMAATPLFLALVVVEGSDVMFAVDSVPAVFTVTNDPFIAFTSNVFAILGLRALYFAVAAVLRNFRHLQTSLVFLLAFIGVKMTVIHHYRFPAVVSLCVICGILAIGILASLLRVPGTPKDAPADPNRDHTQARGARRFASLAGVTLCIVCVVLSVGVDPQAQGLAVAGGVTAWLTEYASVRHWMGREHRLTQSTPPVPPTSSDQGASGESVTSPPPAPPPPPSAG